MRLEALTCRSSGFELAWCRQRRCHAVAQPVLRSTASDLLLCPTLVPSVCVTFLVCRLESLDAERSEAASSARIAPCNDYMCGIMAAFAATAGHRSFPCSVRGAAVPAGGRTQVPLPELSWGGIDCEAPAAGCAYARRLMMHRHWTLFEAFQYSPYVAPRLQTWRDGGLAKLQLLFVNMGVPIEQARQSFGEGGHVRVLLPCVKHCDDHIRRHGP